MTRRLGCHADVRQEGEPLFSAHRLAAAPVPNFGTVDVLSIAPKNQGNTSSCTGQAGAGGARLAYLAAGMECPELSALSLYRPARNLDGSFADDDNGSQLALIVQAFTLQGVAPEAAWPFDEAKVNAQLPFSALHSAYDRHGVRSHHRVTDGSWDDWKRAIGGKLPVIAGWSVTEAFCEADGREIFDVQRGPFVGGHAMDGVTVGTGAYIESLLGEFGFRAVDSEQDEEFGVLTGSWGSSYGYNGRIVVRRAFIEAARDSWALDVRGAL